MSKTKDMVIDDLNKEQTIKYLAEMMATVQMAHFKGREVGVRVHEGDDAQISIDLYHFEGDGLPVCEGLNPCKVRHYDGLEEDAEVFAMHYDPDDERHPLTLIVAVDEGADTFDVTPDQLPDKTLQNIAAWLELAMTPAKQEAKPDPKQIKGLMDRWAHFCYSHPPYDEVILWMVGGSKQHYLYQHFCSKFLHLCSVCHDDTMSAWIKFYRELDDQWAERLMEYVYCEWKN